jgi:Uma2 family endonuclease
MAVSPGRRLFTVDEYHRMADAGIFTEDDRVELIGGEIVRMSPIGPRHAGTVMKLVRLLIERLGRQADIAPQNPAILDDLSEPQPDICVMRPRPDSYTSAHPRPDDILLVIEVSDSSLAFDRETKAPRYALAGVPELWIVNLIDDRLEVYREPGRAGYEDARFVWRGQEISPFAFREVTLTADEILPPKHL